MNPDALSTDLRTALRRLKLSPLFDTLPERFALARQQKMPHPDFLLLVLQDEVSRRDTQSASLRAQKAHLDLSHLIENWDETAKVTLDRELLNELLSLRFLDSHGRPLAQDPQAGTPAQQIRGRTPQVPGRRPPHP